jgi:hypothetical protein
MMSVLACGLLLSFTVGCSDEVSRTPVADATVPGVSAPTRESDLEAVDEYLVKWDRFAQGENDQVAFLRENKTAFERALAQLLTIKDKRAPARMVFYAVVQVGGAIPVDSELGRAALATLGPDFPVVTGDDGEEVLFCADLYFWWQDNKQAYEAYPLFEEWGKRDFAQQVAIPMYDSTRQRK